MDCLTHEELQTALFDLLCVFDDIAKENGLRYTLDGGTLLGAVRHKGFIPWDDDVDVAMPRPDFERLRAMPREVKGRYRICGPLDESLPYPFIKFCDMTVRCQESITGGAFEEYLWVDVFPLDGASDCLDGITLQHKTITNLRLSAARKFLPSKRGMKKFLKGIYQPIAARVAPAMRDYEYVDTLAREVPFGGSARCRDAVWSTVGRAPYRTGDFDCLSVLTFCGREFPAVEHWDEVLTVYYGDYMELPPEDHRVTHGTRAWRV